MNSVWNHDARRLWEGVIGERLAAMQAVADAEKLWVILYGLMVRTGRHGWPKSFHILGVCANWWADEIARRERALERLQCRYAGALVQVQYLGWR